MVQPPGSAPPLPTPPTWLELMLLMVHGPGRTEGVDLPDPSLRGTIRSVEGQELPHNITDRAVVSPVEPPAMTGADLPDEASLGQRQNALLARRPWSEAPWELRWHDPSDAHRWSTLRWDWAILVDQARFTEDLDLAEAGCAAIEACFPDE